MILSICGYTCSGSSAVIHLLKEYDKTNVIDFECMILDLPDGIRDLDYCFHASGSYFREDRAFYRFLQFVHNHRYMQTYSHKKIDALSRRYIDDLTGVIWQGRSIYDYAYKDNFEKYTWFAKRLFEKIIYKYKKVRVGFTNRNMRIKNRSCDFYDITRKYMDNVIELFGGDISKINVLDQLMPPVHTEEYFKYVNNGRAIIVDRDPRDMFLNLQLGVDCKCVPMSSEKFIAYHKLWWEDRFSQLNNERILRIQFEELIYEYENTVNKIEKFLGLDKPNKKGLVFQPGKSINNTQIFKRVSGFEKDIELIEEQLKDYLYNFPENNDLNINKEYKYIMQKGKMPKC